jgi:hypothetical protein
MTDYYSTDRDITTELVDRLNEKDDSRDYVPEKPGRQDNDRWSEHSRDDLDRSASIRGAWHGHQAAALTRSRVNPVPPEATSDTDLRGDIENAVQWYSAPVGDRQTIARFMSDHQQMQKDARALGIEPPKTMTDIAVAKNGMAQQGAGDPAVGMIHQVADAYGTSPSQVMQNFVAADNFIRQDPIGAAQEILRQSYSGVEELLSSDMADYANRARQSGTTLPEAVGRYIAAEEFLEKDPVGGIRWLCENYGVDPRSL